jgi:hypothetical protein
MPASRVLGNYLRNMQRQCAWFGCSAVASATYTFDSSTRTVWLDTPFEGGARAGDLCDRHARSLKPPRGWHVEDRRDAAVEDRRNAGVEDPKPEVAPASDPETELRKMLDAHSPLLSRAFRSSGASWEPVT